MGNPAWAVRAEGLTRRFGAFVAVDRVTFHIPRGSIWGFLGPNGAGKSTTIRMLCGILAPSEGTAEVLGFDVARSPERVKERIGYMAQRASLYPDLTVWENLVFYGGIYGLGPREARDRAAEWIARAGLRGQERTRAGDLAGGWTQRLAFGCAVLHRPQILFLDEPTSGVDPVSRRDMWDLIGEFAEGGTTVIVTTHYMDEAEHCDTLAFLYEGRIVALGTPEDIRTREGRVDVVEVLTPTPTDALDILAALPGVYEVGLAGRALRVAVADAGEVLPRIREALARYGIAVEGAAPAPPSLEDSFVGIVERRRKEGSQ